MPLSRAPLKLDPSVKTKADRCVMCGLCLPHCPTYGKTGNEAESPRGRISLIQALATGQLTADATVRGHLDNCLLCRACETKCPSGVEFGAIMDGARNALTTDHPVAEQRISLKAMATDKQRRKRDASLLWLADKSGLRSLGRSLGITKILGLERFEQLAPHTKRPHGWQPHYPAIGSTRGNIALFTGCFGDMFDQQTLDDAVYVLNKAGYGVYVPEQQTCCGALSKHSGDNATAEQLAQQNLTAFGDLNIETIISCASGCGAHLNDYPSITGHTFAVQDINAFLCNLTWPEALRPRPLDKTIAVHEPCSLRNVLKTADTLYTLLDHIPNLNVVPLPGNERCCGAAGSYMIEHPEMADSLRDDKLEALKQSAPDILVSANIGCSLHIGAGLRKAGIKIEVLHPISLLARQLRSAT